MLRRCGILASILALWAGWTAPASAGRPNVLLIAVDDLNDWVGCLGGHPQAKTPNMDALARRGVVFSNAHCQSPLCNPSRGSLLFGVRPATSGLYTLLPGVRSVPALKDRASLPQHFGAEGWRTFCAGKIFHDGSIVWKDRHREFQQWEVTGDGTKPPKPFVSTPANHPAMDWGAWPENERDTPDWKIAQAACDAIRAPASGAEGGKPFFVACGFRLPHVPCYAPQQWFDQFPASDVTLPPVLDDDRADVPPFAWRLHWKLPEPRLSWLKSSDQWRPLVRAYLATTTFMDDQLGKVLAALRESGQEDRTIVILFSDHGWHLGEKGISGKNSLWERSTRVPLIIAGPGIAPGRCQEPVELLDLFPTLCELSGLAIPSGQEGHSLLPQIKNPAARRPWPAITTHNQGNNAVRTRKWRYIRYADASEELYDMEADPNEWKNLASDPKFSPVIEEHRKWLPPSDAAAVAGSKQRLLERRDGKWFWEGAEIREEELEK
jgi:arylsulfatase A-like enzyme